MDVAYCETAEESFRSTLRALDAETETEGICVLATPAEELTPAAIDDTLAELSTPIFGGIFPEVIFEGDSREEGIIVIGLETEPNITTITPGGDATGLDTESGIPDETMFVFVDAYADDGETFIDQLFNSYGVGYNYIGGGAGTLAGGGHPCLFTNDGLIDDAAVVARLPKESTIGVEHGWTEIGGPFEITDADGRVVKSLDGEPAYELYADVVERESDLTVTRENFFEVAKSHPFGISRLGAEQIVRDPFEVGEDGSLTCFGELPEGEFVHILQGDHEALIDAAGRAYEAATADAPADAAVFAFDCISRTQYLGDAFSRELDALSVDSDPIGALTIGEVANDGEGHLDYYNKTAVVGAVTEP